jgi:hypothetical protein
MNKIGGLAENVQNKGQMQQAELAADQPLLNFFSSPCFSVT